MRREIGTERALRNELDHQVDACRDHQRQTCRPRHCTVPGFSLPAWNQRHLNPYESENQKDNSIA